MKKLTTLFLLVFISFDLFAEPQIPKNFFKDTDTQEHFFQYVSSDFNYSYAVWTNPYTSNNYECELHIKKSSLVKDFSMTLHIYFKSEQQMDKFIKTLHLSDIENEFNRIRKLIILNDNYPCYDKYIYNFEKPPEYINYYFDGSLLL